VSKSAGPKRPRGRAARSGPADRRHGGDGGRLLPHSGPEADPDPGPDRLERRRLAIPCVDRPVDGARVGRERAGLRFPDEKAPGWGEFRRQAFVIGCASATADVNATSKSMRRARLAHGVVAFLFNAIILALTINIGAGLV